MPCSFPHGQLDCARGQHKNTMSLARAALATTRAHSVAHGPPWQLAGAPSWRGKGGAAGPCDQDLSILAQVQPVARR
eukprot:8537947-Alexandrium_andersonii.AAC.1